MKAYRRAAAHIRNLPESLDEMVRREEDLTQFAGIGAAIASAIREIVTHGNAHKAGKAARRGHARHSRIERASKTGSQARHACL